MHEDAGIRQLKFEGLVHVVIVRLRACKRMLVLAIIRLSMHEDAGIRQLKFEGLVHVVIIRLRACTRMLVSDNSSLKG